MKKRIIVLPILLSLMVSGCANSGASQEAIHPSEIILNKNSLELYPGDTFTLTASVLPEDADNKEVTWSSENSEIASVDNAGLVSALKEGKTTITATSKDDNRVFSSCTISVLKKDSEEVEDDSLVTFTTKKMNAYHYSKTNQIQVDTYFRSDRLKQIPYISLKEYYKLLVNKDLVIETTSENVYKITSGNQGVAIIDTKLDTLDSDDYQNFISTTVYRQDGVTNVYFDGAPFLRVKNVETDKPATHKTINFRKYGINLFGKENDIYLPLITASNIFQGPTMITCFYNKDSIYFIDPNDPKFETSSVYYDSDYIDGISKFFNNERRNESEAKFSYGELCFLLDTYYGLPGREYLHEEFARDHDIDKVLSEKNDMTKKAKQFLQSTNLLEYYAGMYMLDAFLSDAGHSVVASGVKALLNKPNYEELSTKVSECLSEIGFSSSDYDAKKNASYTYYAKVSGAIDLYSAKSLGYKVEGDTLIYRFDAFDYDIHEWNDYYKNVGTNSLPTDPVGSFKQTLEQFKDDPNIKNVVVDISNNGGGFADVAAAFMGLICGKTYHHIHDMINDNYMTVNYEFDANFDGKFDEKDKEVKYNFNFAILCSARSFSCGNILPLQAKENGIMILGDKSGGGCCAIIDAVTAEGFYIRLSCQNHLCYLNGEEAEYGVPADYKMVIGEEDFSKFYDLSIMSREMNNFYNKQ